MATGFQSLVDGSCGTANPLMRLTTHFTEDKAKVDFADRTGHNGSDRMLNYQHSRHKTAESNFADEFLRQQQHPIETIGPINSFNMKNLLREVQPRQLDHRGEMDKQWSEEFVQKFSHQQVPNQVPNLVSKMHSNGTSSRFESGTIGATESRWASEYLEEFDQQFQSDICKDPVSKAARELHDVLDKDTKFSKSEFKSFLKNLEENTSTEEDFNWDKEFLSSHSTAEQGWANEFSEYTDTDFQSFLDEQKDKTVPAETAYTTDFWENLEDQWKSSSQHQDREDLSERWAEDFSSSNGASFENYQFQPDNPLTETKDCLESGKLKLAEGDLPSAVLLFEAAAQQQPENAEVWFLLGTSQAKNEQDPLAIAALHKSLSLDPKNLEAILALAASLTNESNQAQACFALKDWINSNPKYSPVDGAAGANLETLNRKMVSSFMTREQHQETMDLFLKAARINHHGGQVDPDVQSGLGILFNLSGDFDKAADCFKAALNVKPDDLLLWNRLGATLANGNRSEEAISAYHEALRLYPGFVRSRYNLGISCLNLKAYQEAVEHFLTGLNFQAAGRGLNDSGSGQNGAMSETIWGSLRLGLSLLGRNDLYKEVEARNLKKLSSEFKLNQN